jgi:hypothetical protein
MTAQAVTLATPTVPTVAFNYDLVTEDFAGTLAMTAERIRKRARQVSTDIIEIGRDLLSIKAELDHGQFLAWISAEFSWSERSAQYFMSIAAEWGDLPPATVADLPVKLLRDLSGRNAPADIKAEVRADLDAGKPVDVKVVKDRIKAARKTIRQPEPPIHHVPPSPKIDLLPTPKPQAHAEVDVDIYARLFGPLTGAEWMRLGEDCWYRPIKRGPFKRPGQYSDEFMKLVAHFDVPLKEVEAAE